MSCQANVCLSSTDTTSRLQPSTRRKRQYLVNSPKLSSLIVGEFLYVACAQVSGLGNGGKGHGEPVRVDEVSSETCASDAFATSECLRSSTLAL